MNRTTILIALLILTLASLILLLARAGRSLADARKPFTPPGPEQRRLALGDTSTLPAPLRRALEPADDFAPIPAPGPSDWLANHPEPGQTFDQFIRSRPNRPDATRKILYLQPLGQFNPEAAPPLDDLKTFASAYFIMDVRILPTLDFAEGDIHITTRKNPGTGQTQLLSTDILALLARKLPPDAFAVLAVTMTDLYPEPSWNYVFGQASLSERVGVYSFARYDPGFFGQDRPADWRKLQLWRSCQVLAHETAHMFGLYHCIYYHCQINGSNHLAESDAAPLHLCPIDLRKFQWNIGFDAIERERRLHAFYVNAGFEQEAKWTAKRLARIRQSS